LHIRVYPPTAEIFVDKRLVSSGSALIRLNDDETRSLMLEATGYRGHKQDVNDVRAASIEIHLEKMAEWRTGTGTEMIGGVSTIDGLLAVATRDGHVHLIEPERGALVRKLRVSTGPALVGQPFVAGGSLCQLISDGSIVVLNTEVDESPITRTISVDGEITSPAAIHNDHAYFGVSGGKVLSVNIATGETVWTFDAEAQVTAEPKVAGGRVFVGTTASMLYGVDQESGEKAWSYRAEGAIHVAPAQGAIGLVIGTDAGTVHGVDAATGTEKWVVRVGGRVRSVPLIAGPAVFVGCSIGAVQRINVRNTAADIGWTFRAAGPVHGTPTLGAGTLFFGADDQKVYAVDAETGELNWSFATEGRVRVQPRVVGDALLVGSQDQFLYALRTR
jgi:outer membrane protein assembly factor BamB